MSKAKSRTKRVVYKPSQVLRLVKAGKIAEDQGVESSIYCRACGKKDKATTRSPSFWENGSYMWCDRCKASTLARPVFPTFEIDLTGERKRYPLILAPKLQNLDIRVGTHKCVAIVKD